MVIKPEPSSHFSKMSWTTDFSQIFATFYPAHQCGISQDTENFSFTRRKSFLKGYPVAHVWIFAMSTALRREVQGRNFWTVPLNPSMPPLQTSQFFTIRLCVYLWSSMCKAIHNLITQNQNKCRETISSLWDFPPAYKWPFSSRWTAGIFSLL